jgi:hypothetical protein
MSVEKSFKDEHGTVIRVKINRSNIELTGNDSEEPYFSLKESSDLLKFIITGAYAVWKSFKPKEADSMGSDYYEFYDRKSYCNGYLSVNSQGLDFDRGYLNGETDLWYRFNKAKCQSFIYDVFKFFPGLKVLEETK